MTHSPNDAQSSVIIKNVPYRISEGQAKILMGLSLRGRVKLAGLSMIDTANINKLQRMGAIDLDLIDGIALLRPGVELHQPEE